MPDLVTRIPALVNNPQGGAPIWTEINFPLALTIKAIKQGHGPPGRKSSGHGMDCQDEAALFIVIGGSITMNGRQLISGDIVFITCDSPQADPNNPGYENEVGPNGHLSTILMTVRPVKC